MAPSSVAARARRLLRRRTRPGAPPASTRGGPTPPSRRSHARRSSAAACSTRRSAHRVHRRRWRRTRPPTSVRAKQRVPSFCRRRSRHPTRAGARRGIERKRPRFTNRVIRTSCSVRRETATSSIGPCISTSRVPTSATRLPIRSCDRRSNTPWTGAPSSAQWEVRQLDNRCTRFSSREAPGSSPDSTRIRRPANMAIRRRLVSCSHGRGVRTG